MKATDLYMFRYISYFFMRGLYPSWCHRRRRHPYTLFCRQPRIARTRCRPPIPNRPPPLRPRESRSPDRVASRGQRGECCCSGPSAGGGRDGGGQEDVGQRTDQASLKIRELRQQVMRLQRRGAASFGLSASKQSFLDTAGEVFCLHNLIPYSELT